MILSSQILWLEGMLEHFITVQNSKIKINFSEKINFFPLMQSSTAHGTRFQLFQKHKSTFTHSEPSPLPLTFNSAIESNIIHDIEQLNYKRQIKFFLHKIKYYHLFWRLRWKYPRTLDSNRTKKKWKQNIYFWYGT